MVRDSGVSHEMGTVSLLWYVTAYFEVKPVRADVLAGKKRHGTCTHVSLATGHVTLGEDVFETQREAAGVALRRVIAEIGRLESYRRDLESLWLAPTPNTHSVPVKR